MSFVRLAAMTMAIAAASVLSASVTPATDGVPARLAIYYGYPSLVNGSAGDIEKAAAVFSNYDVVVLGDGLEFADKQVGRYPEGDPEEHQKTLQIIAATRKRNSETRFYGYVCLGEIPWPKGKQTAFSTKELEQRIQLWKRAGVFGIFFDEAGYDYPVVTRERQNQVVRMTHDLGLSAFMNAYFVEHLFGVESKPANANGPEKNPEHLATLLDKRDLFLLESIVVKNGNYESFSAMQERLKKALGYRQRYGSQIFATTTMTERQTFRPEMLNYAWWTAQLYGLDGFSWGEANFAAASNILPDRHCAGGNVAMLKFAPTSLVQSENSLLWRKAGPYVVVVDEVDHSVRRISRPDAGGMKTANGLLSSSARQQPLSCNGVNQ